MTYIFNTHHTHPESTLYTYTPAYIPQCSDLVNNCVNEFYWSDTMYLLGFCDWLDGLTMIDILPPRLSIFVWR